MTWTTTNGQSVDSSYITLFPSRLRGKTERLWEPEIMSNLKETVLS